MSYVASLPRQATATGIGGHVGRTACENSPKSITGDFDLVDLSLVLDSILLIGVLDKAAQACKCITIRNSRIVGELDAILLVWISGLSEGWDIS
ncbi:hypothetical protein QWA68_015820 [Fusarium oxysporum]|nr:hypothetical protein QWA68_015820 [Fusarium oxysporum]